MNYYDSLLITTYFLLTFLFDLLLIYILYTRIVPYVSKLKAGGKSEIHQADKAMHIIDEAHQTAILIVKNAEVKAQNLLDSSTIFNKELRREMESSIEHISKKHLTTLNEVAESILNIYKNELNDQKVQSLSVVKNAANETKEQLIRDLEDFRNLLREETAKSRKQVREKIEKSYEEIRKELESYRTDQMKKIDENIYTIVANASREILTESLDIERHKKLVFASLEEAKKQGIFEV